MSSPPPAAAATPEPATNVVTAAPAVIVDSSGTARIALRGTVWVTIGNYVTQLIGFATMLFLARVLAPEIFGYFALAGFWSGILSLRAKAGLNFAAVQHNETSGELLGTYYVLDALMTAGSMVLAVIACIVLLFLQYPVQVVLILITLMSTEVISLLVSPLSMALERELQLSRIGLITLMSYTISYVGAIAFALAGHGIWALISINLIYAPLASAGIYMFSRRRIPKVFKLTWRFDRTLAKHLLQAGLSAGLSATALGTVVGQFDNFLIGTFVGIKTLGFYDRAYRVAQWPNILIGTVITRAAFLTFAKVKDDPPRLAHTVRLMFWVLTSLSIVISIWLFFSAPDLITILLTDKWLPSSGFMRFLSISNLLWGFVSLGFWLSVALGHKRQTIIMSALQAATLVLVATPLTLLLGSDGTLAGVGASMLVGSIVSCVYIFRHVDLRPVDVFVRPVIASVITVVLMAMMTNLDGWSHLSPLIHTLLIGIAATTTLVSILFILKPSEMIERVRYLMKTWRRA